MNEKCKKLIKVIALATAAYGCYKTGEVVGGVKACFKIFTDENFKIVWNDDRDF